jgi:demethylspheroidene O-methyltransferase
MATTGMAEAGVTRWGAWVDRCLAWRDRLLADPRFQRRAASFAFTRPTARRHARELFDLVGGFVYSQVLLACVQLRLFDWLAAGPRTADETAARFALPLDSALRLLDAAVALRLLAHRGQGRYGLGELGAPMVGNVAVAAMVQHHAALYADLADPVALLRASPAQRQATAMSRYWAYDAAAAPAPDERVTTYSALMAASQPLVAEEILDAYPFDRHRCLLDVGGGDGRFAQSAAERHPALRLKLFDLPAVAAAAQARFERAGLARRAIASGGSFFDDPLPAGADVATLVRVIHDHDDPAAMAILRAVHAALPDGGVLVLAEPMAETPGAEAMGAYFGLYLLAMGRGRPRSAKDLTRMLTRAGFGSVRSLATRQPLQTRLLIARRVGTNPAKAQIV